MTILKTEKQKRGIDSVMRQECGISILGLREGLLPLPECQERNPDAHDRGA
jgi:hypothetical protein